MDGHYHSRYSSSRAFVERTERSILRRRCPLVTEITAAHTAIRPCAWLIVQSSGELVYELPEKKIGEGIRALPTLKNREAVQEVSNRSLIVGVQQALRAAARYAIVYEHKVPILYEFS